MNQCVFLWLQKYAIVDALLLYTLR